MTLIETAYAYVGKTEKPNNSGFYDAALEEAMIAIGWRAPWAYCMLFQKMLIKLAHPERADLQRMITPSVLDTFENLLKGGFEITLTPEVGSLVFWESWDKGVLTIKGHVGLVSHTFNDGTFRAIEGNTGADGGRDGDGIYEKTRAVLRVPRPDRSSLITKGFVKI